MKRIISAAVITAALAVSACGGNSACAQAKRDAQAWANNYVQNLPTSVSQKTIDQLAQSTYEATIVGDSKYAGCQ